MFPSSVEDFAVGIALWKFLSFLKVFPPYHQDFVGGVIVSFLQVFPPSVDDFVGGTSTF